MAAEKIWINFIINQVKEKGEKYVSVASLAIYYLSMINDLHWTD